MVIPRLRPSVLIPFVIRGVFAAWPLGLLVLLILAQPSRAPGQAAPDQGVIQTETNIVLLNVVVKDKHGKPVDGLQMVGTLHVPL